MDTVAAISTAVGRAGIGIVRMTGPESLEILEKVFRQDVDFVNRKLTYGHIWNGENDIDEVLAVYMKGPHTYTREDVVEIYCHGGVVAVREVLNILLKNGADMAEPGEFTKRAYLNGRLDLVQAEAVLDIIDSNTKLSHEQGLNQLSGGLSREVESIRNQLIEILANTITEIDFPEDENDIMSDQEKIRRLEDINRQIERLLKSAKRGRILRDGIKTLILGRPNVGKSSLLNALLRDDRAIVTDIPGTTRDTIEEVLDLDGIPLKLIDTAGIRETDDKIERIGVDIAKAHVEDSDLILLVLDSSQPLSDEDREILRMTEDKERIIILNKIDLEMKIDLDDFDKKELIEMSALRTLGIDELLDRIKDLFFQDKLEIKEDLIVSNMRHIELLRRSKENVESALEDLRLGLFLDLIEVDINSAIENLGSIIGSTIDEDILDKIFSDFCIGK